MKGGRGNCVICNRTTYNSKSGLCRKHWEEKAWGKDKEYVRIYKNGKIDGETINLSKELLDSIMNARSSLNIVELLDDKDIFEE